MRCGTCNRVIQPGDEIEVTVKSKILIGENIEHIFCEPCWMMMGPKIAEAMSLRRI